MRLAGVSAGIFVAAVDALYLAVVGSQGTNPQYLRAPFVAAFIALMAITAALSSLVSAPPWRSLLLGFSAAGLLLLGFFAIFSIGLPLMVAGLLVLAGLIATLTRPGAPGRSGKTARITATGGAVAAVLVLLVGISITELALRCPASGVESGSGADFLTGSYQYTCDNGKLTILR
jgi:hypothetical protein